jgi:uracil-DNA glycosylase family 4
MERIALTLSAQIIDCECCELHAQCTLPVPFSGEPGPILIIGEAPGEQEDKVGRPFVGPAGQLLRQLLKRSAFDPDDLAYCNTACCWPHGTPTWDHVRSCDKNKWDQIAYIDPTWILLLGKVALRAMRPELDISRGRSRPFQHGKRICFASFHPAAALRNAKFERGLKRDLDLFARLVKTPDWQTLIPDDCSACDADAVWWEASGLGWCERHVPEPERVAYDARARQQADELDAARRRDLALVQVADAADPAWATAAWDALMAYLRTHPEFFVDDFWNATEAVLARPRESRALGPIVLRAARLGHMAKSGKFRKSTASNMTEKPIWTSNLYRAEAAHG